MSAAGDVSFPRGVKSSPGVGHAFLNHTRPDASRPQAPADAFERAVGFFGAHLSGGR
jgi:dienelactone hydrolase